MVRYAEKVKKDPAKSLIFDQKADNEKQFMSTAARVPTSANSPVAIK